jgi:hypothetical protein
VGTWELTGHTLDSAEDNITGWTAFEWLPGGFFLKVTGWLNFMGFRVESLEVVGYDPTSQTFPSTVYSNMDGNALPYHWDVQGNTVTHWEQTSKFTGTLSEDGKTLTGGWRPKVAEQQAHENAYDVIMTRTG